MKGVLYYELLHPNETVNSNRYSQQLIRLNKKIERDRPFTGKGKRPVKLLVKSMTTLGLMLVNL